MDPAILLRTAVLMLIAYLAGSVPVGSIVAQRVGGPDLRSKLAAVLRFGWIFMGLIQT